MLVFSELAGYTPTNIKHNMDNVTYSSLWKDYVWRHDLLSKKKTSFLIKNKYSCVEEETCPLSQQEDVLFNKKTYLGLG